MWLPNETFKSIIHHAPLITIDLIVRNEKGKVLFGKCVNAPSTDRWFALGWCARKNETLDDSFICLVCEEFGIESEITPYRYKLLGVFEYFHDDGVFKDTKSTNYMVLAYELKLGNDLSLPFYQPNRFKCWKVSECYLDVKVYLHT